MPTIQKLLHCSVWRVVLFGLAVLIAVPVWAQSSRVVLVEEHWELQLGQPDPDQSAPQITMVMSPDRDLDDVHFLFTLNHRNAPEYGPGGMQVQLWTGEVLLGDSVGEKEGTLNQEQDVVRWVQRITLDEDTLHFRVLDGTSQTWGAFGGDDLSLSVPTSLNSLNHYRPGTSLTESQVSYAENRVGSLVLTKLVWVMENGDVHEQNAPIAIDTSLDP